MNAPAVTEEKSASREPTFEYRVQNYQQTVYPLALNQVAAFKRDLPQGDGVLVRSIRNTLEEKASHQIAGAAIISLENPLKEESIKVMSGMIYATDMIDTVSDTGILSDDSTRDLLLKEYINIFSSGKSRVELSSDESEDYRSSIGYILHHMQEVHSHLDALLRNSGLNEKDQEFVLDVMRREAISYVDGIKAMDSRNYSTPEEYLERVASKVSNLSILGIVDCVATTQKDFKRDDIQTFANAVSLFHSSHILEDGAVDIQQDNETDSPNFWRIHELQERSDEIDQIATTEAGKIVNGIATISAINQRLGDHWKFVMGTKLKFYGDQFIGKKLVELPLMRYFATMKKVFAQN